MAVRAALGPATPRRGGSQKSAGELACPAPGSAGGTEPAAPASHPLPSSARTRACWEGLALLPNPNPGKSRVLLGLRWVQTEGSV